MMSTQQELHITLPSNVKSKTEVEENTVTSYKTTLKRKLVFPSNEDWRVGLSEIIYTKNWYNIKHNRILYFLREDGVAVHFYNPEMNICVENECEYVLQKGVHDVIEDLIRLINRVITKFRANFEQTPFFSYDYITKLVKLQYGSIKNEKGKSVRCFPIVGSELENIFGLTLESGEVLSDTIFKDVDNVVDPFWFKFLKKYKEYDRHFFTGQQFEEIFIKDSEYYNAKRVVDLNAGLSTLYIYTNIIEDNFVGDEYAPLLRVIPVYDKDKFGSVVKETYDFPHFIKLQSRDFESIHVEIRDDTGSPIAFQSGRVVVKLIIKRYG